MVFAIVFFVLAFIIRSYVASFTIKGFGIQRERAPRIMWSATGMFFLTAIPFILSVISLVIFIVTFDTSWIIKLPVGLIGYWFFYWELPLILFQNTM